MRLRYEKKSLCMISMWKVRRIFWRTFKDVTVTNRKTIHIIKRKLTQTQLPQERTKWKWLLKKNWMNLVIGLYIPLENPLNVSHTMQWFEVSRFFYFSKGISICKCENTYADTRNPHVTKGHIFDICCDLSGFYLLAYGIVNCPVDLNTCRNILYEEHISLPQNQVNNFWKVLR